MEIDAWKTVLSGNSQDQFTMDICEPASCYDNAAPGDQLRKVFHTALNLDSVPHADGNQLDVEARRY